VGNVSSDFEGVPDGGIATDIDIGSNPAQTDVQRRRGRH
jgi:hypothetical protein